jgi:gliding motility-associated lipoprotein GldH
MNDIYSSWLKSKIAACLLILVLLVSCKPGTMYEKHTKIDNYSWNRFHLVQFQVPVKNISGSYDFILALRYMTGIPFRELVVTVTIDAPSGEVRSNDYRIKIRDQDGNLLGEGLGDIYDLEVPLRTGYEFTEKGTCKVEIESRMQQVEVVGLMEIGLIVRKSR